MGKDAEAKDCPAIDIEEDYFPNNTNGTSEDLIKTRSKTNVNVDAENDTANSVSNGTQISRMITDPETVTNNKKNHTSIIEGLLQPKREFKLRVVPLAKLLEKPPEEEVVLIDSDSSDSEKIISLRSKQSNENKSKTKRKSKSKSKTNSDTKAVGCKRFVIKLKRLPAKILSSAKPLPSKSRNKVIETSMTDSEKPTTSSRARSRACRMSSDEDSPAGEDQCSVADSNSQKSSDSEGATSDSEVIPKRKRRIFNSNAKKSSEDDSDFEPDSKKQNNKRRRIKHASSGDEDEDDSGDEKNKHKRKHIRKIIKTSELDISTQTATKEEEARRKRIEERQKLYNKIYEKPESTEVNELVLDFDEETKKPILEVDRGLLKKLKPHQVTGVKFMWDACFETLQDANENPGSGCILAHCMGLGKTLQIVALTHTLITNAHRTHVERVLIISPLSTLNNWAREFKMWMGYARKKNIEIYDMSKYRDKATRIFKLNEWFNEGGVCILGYDMYRILSNEKAKGLRKKQRETLQQSLVDPGPDVVVCDEGHLLKNEKTSISKAVTKMRTKRRIVLTGTPLQNNPKE